MALIMESLSVVELCTALGESEKVLNHLTENFRDWLKLQPHLPQNIPKEVLEYFIIGTKMSLEQVKHKIDMFFTMKRLVPELYANRDPRDSSFISLHSMMQIVYLPKLTPEKYRVCIVRPFVDNYSKFDAFDSVNNYGFVLLRLDYIEYRSGMLKKLLLSVVETCSKVQNSYRLSANGERVHAYPKGDYESLYQHVPKSILPKEYGGGESSMADLDDLWHQKVEAKRDWFLEQEEIVVDERIRPGPSVNGENLFGLSGSFRKLDVD